MLNFHVSVFGCLFWLVSHIHKLKLKNKISLRSSVMIVTLYNSDFLLRVCAIRSLDSNWGCAQWHFFRGHFWQCLKWNLNLWSQWPGERPSAQTAKPPGPSSTWFTLLIKMSSCTYSFQMQFLSMVSVQCIDYVGTGWFDSTEVVCKTCRQSTFHIHLHCT